MKSQFCDPHGHKKTKPFPINLFPSGRQYYDEPSQVNIIHQVHYRMVCVNYDQCGKRNDPQMNSGSFYEEKTSHPAEGSFSVRIVGGSPSIILRVIAYSFHQTAGKGVI